jgi:CrcB protein
LAGQVMLARLGPGFPWWTLTINVVGGLLMGLLVGALARGDGFSDTARLFVGVGILGGFTTFSSFSMEFWMLFERGQNAQAAAYVLASVIGAIAACGLGLFIMRQVPA